MNDYNKYVEDFCKDYIAQCGYDPEDYAFYDLAEHDLYIFTVYDDVAFIVPDFY